MEEDEDLHECFLCKTQIRGLENYVKHRKDKLCEAKRSSTPIMDANAASSATIQGFMENLGLFGESLFGNTRLNYLTFEPIINSSVKSVAINFHVLPPVSVFPDTVVVLVGVTKLKNDQFRPLEAVNHCHSDDHLTLEVT